MSGRPRNTRKSFIDFYVQFPKPLPQGARRYSRAPNGNRPHRSRRHPALRIRYLLPDWEKYARRELSTKYTNLHETNEQQSADLEDLRRSNTEILERLSALEK